MIQIEKNRDVENDTRSLVFTAELIVLLDQASRLG
jgi:hypothetical protein